jgi:hypothetical protein
MVVLRNPDKPDNNVWKEEGIMMDKENLSRKEFLKLTATGVVAVVAGGLLAEKALAAESLMESHVHDEPAIGQEGYSKRVARLFKDSGLPEKATSI